MATPTDDDALVSAARDGDRAAMNALLERHYDRVWAICRRLAGNEADAADATQEALLAIVRGLPKFDGRARFTTWSHRVATNACLDELRRRSRRPRPGLPDDEAHTSVPDPALDIGVTVTDREVLNAALAALPPEFREPVVLRDCFGHDYADIAEILGLPAGTVRSRIARGRARLAEALGNQPAIDERPTN